MSVPGRLRKACDECHKRKQKCSLANSIYYPTQRYPTNPCTICIKLRITCQFSPPAPRGRKRKNGSSTNEGEEDEEIQSEARDRPGLSEANPKKHHSSYGISAHGSHLMDPPEFNPSNTTNRLDLPGLEFDHHSSNTTSNHSTSPPGFKPMHISTSNQIFHSQPRPIERFSTWDSSGGESSLQSEAQKSDAPQSFNNRTQNSGQLLDDLDLSNPQILENWLSDLGVSGIPDDLGEELIDISFLDPAMIEAGDQEQEDPTRNSSYSGASGSLLSNSNSGGSEAARMKVDSLLSPAPTSTSLGNTNFDLFTTPSSSSSPSFSKSSRSIGKQRDHDQNSSNLKHQSQARPEKKSLDLIIAGYIENLQKEIDSSNDSSISSIQNSLSSSSFIKLPSLKLIAEANNVLGDIFPTDDSHLRFVYGEHANGHGHVSQDHHNHNYSIAPMLGLSLVTQILNSISLIKKTSRSRKEREKGTESENQTSLSSNPIPNPDPSASTSTSTSITITNTTEQTSNQTSNSISSFLSPFISSLNTSEIEKIEEILIKGQLNQLKLNINKSLSMSKHHHKGKGPCIMKEWGSRLLSQTEDLEI